jgi:hypothetical protein
MFGGVRLLPASVSFLSFLIFTTASFAQTSIDDIHVAPRQRVIPEASIAQPHLPSGIGLIRSHVEPVTVYVTSTC